MAADAPCHRLRIALALLTVASGAAGYADGAVVQDRSAVASDQIGSPDGRDPLAIGQVARPQDDASQPPVRQITTPGAAAAAPVQLAPRQDRIPQVPRTAERDRATQASAPLSKTSDSRNVATARLTGADRCDPQAAAAQSGRCRNVIESRADSFATERPDLSPEQRLLAERYVPADGGGVVSEVRRVGRNDVDPQSSDAQALAQVLQTQRAEQAAADTAANTQKIDPVLVNAIVNAVNGGK